MAWLRRTERKARTGSLQPAAPPGEVLWSSPGRGALLALPALNLSKVMVAAVWKVPGNTPVCQKQLAGNWAQRRTVGKALHWHCE